MPDQLTFTETLYVAAYMDVIAAVSSVDGYVTRALHNQVDALEVHFDYERREELRDIARERFAHAA